MPREFSTPSAAGDSIRSICIWAFSAGACNLASHLAGQNDRNYDIIKRYSIDGRFINLGRFLRGGHLMDLDWLWDVTISEYRLDLKKLFGRLKEREKEYIIAVTSVATGNQRISNRMRTRWNII